MPGLTIWKTEEMNRLRRDMGRMLARVWDEFGMAPMPFTPRGLDAMELIDQGDALVIRAEVPDFDPSNLTIIASEDRLTLRGLSRDETLREKEQTHRTETRFDSFSRSVRLPCRIVPDQADAVLADGILKISLPKRKPAPAQEIRIRAV